jgi:hypothetical protein
MLSSDWGYLLLRNPTEYVHLPSPEDGNRSSFRNVVFSSFLEHRTMDKVQKSSNPEIYNIICCYIWMWILVSDTEGRMQSENVCEQSGEESMLT